MTVRWHSAAFRLDIPTQHAARAAHEPVPPPPASPPQLPFTERFVSSLAQMLSIPALNVSSQVVSLAAPAWEQQALSAAHEPTGPPLGQPVSRVTARAAATATVTPRSRGLTAAP